VLAQSKNGSGKTGAFGIAMLMAVDRTVAAPQAICISPTRELAVQTCARLQNLARFMTGLQVTTVVGGFKYAEAIKAQVVIATAGKMSELIRKRLLNLAKIKVRGPAAGAGGQGCREHL